jgi:hypothetical protein
MSKKTVCEGFVLALVVSTPIVRLEAQALVKKTSHVKKSTKTLQSKK